MVHCVFGINSYSFPWPVQSVYGEHPPPKDTRPIHNYLMVKGYIYSHLTWIDSSNNGTLVIVSLGPNIGDHVPLSHSDRRPCHLIIASISCRWQIHTTCCIMANVLQTSKVDFQCDKLATDVGGRARVTRDEERVLRGGWTEIRLCRYGGWVVVRTL